MLDREVVGCVVLSGVNKGLVETVLLACTVYLQEKHGGAMEGRFGPLASNKETPSPGPERVECIKSQQSSLCPSTIKGIKNQTKRIQDFLKKYM